MTEDNMSKKETQEMLQITTDFLEGLTNKQFQDLVNGNAVIRYEAKDNHTAYDQMMKKIKQASSSADLERLLKKYTKKELASFCKKYNIEVKAKDTKKVMFQGIASHIQLVDHLSEVKSKSESWNEIESALHEFSTLDEAEDFVVKHDRLQTKKSIVAFAKSLGVYVSQKHTKQEILNRVVDSVVGARLRGIVIRAGG